MFAIIKNTINIGLVFSVLLSSSGLFLNRMDCLISGESYYSLEAFGCCDGESTTTKVTENCCHYEQVLFKMDIENYATISSFNVQAPILSIPHVTENVLAPIKQYLYLSDSGPPLINSGIEKLIQICILRL